LDSKFVVDCCKYHEIGGADVSEEYTWGHLGFKARRLGTMYIQYNKISEVYQY